MHSGHHPHGEEHHHPAGNGRHAEAGTGGGAAHPTHEERLASAESAEARALLFAEMQREARERFMNEQGPIARALKDVRYKVAILSGKGGVGKSTATVNLAATLHQLGKKVVIFDADVHGPSVPKLLGAHGRAGVRSLDHRFSGEIPEEGEAPEAHGHQHGPGCRHDAGHQGHGHSGGHSHGDDAGHGHAGHGHGHSGHSHGHAHSHVAPGEPNVDHHSFLFEPVVTEHGVGVISVASIWPTDETPVMWKGPHKMRAIRQFLSAAHWGDADFLLVDLPPGTGDEVQTIMTAIPGLDGMIVITTPQGISRMVCSKAINAAKELNAPLLGLIENMGVMTCPHCGGHIQPFGLGKGERLARLMEIPFMGSIPFDADVGVAADDGVPAVLADPDGPVAGAFEDVALKLLETLGEPVSVAAPEETEVGS